MSQAPTFNSNDPESQAAWRQWVTDSVVWMQQQLQHLHNCIETRIAETKQMVQDRSNTAEELAESRHSQNLETLERMTKQLELLTVFRENASQKEIEEQAVAAERRRLAQERAKRREQLKDTGWRLVEYGAGAGILTLALAGLYSVARALGL